jgi:uncharacterized membrane protein
MININVKNWKKKSVAWLNNLAYAGLGLVASIQAAELMGYTLDFITPQQKKIIIFAVIIFKFIEKMAAKKDSTTELP